MVIVNTFCTSQITSCSTTSLPSQISRMVINTPCVWIETPIQTMNSLWTPTNSIGTTSCVTGTNCVNQVYIDIETQQLFWEQDVTPTQYYDLARSRVIHFHEVTEYDQMYTEASRENQQRDYKLAQERRRVAQEKSKELLLASLTKEQRRTFEKNNWFVVKGGKTKTEYRINTNGYAGNIEVLESNKRVATLCCHCGGDIPLYDHHLSQKLSIEWDEERFIKTANWRRAA